MHLMSNFSSVNASGHCAEACGVNKNLNSVTILICSPIIPAQPVYDAFFTAYFLVVFEDTTRQLEKFNSIWIYYSSAGVSHFSSGKEKLDFR